MGGGSGGHVTPIVAVLEQAVELAAEPLELRLACDRAFHDRAGQIVDASGLAIKLQVIVAGKMRRYHNFGLLSYLRHPSVIAENLLDIFKVAIGFCQSIVMLLRWRPDVVFCKGGFVCLPVGYAAWCLRIPIVIHDSDARPGLTSRLLAPLSSAIATGYPLKYYRYPKDKSVYTGVPVRQEFSYVTADRQTAAKRQLAIDSDQVLIVCFGGSLGAQSINDAVLAAAASLQGKNIKIICISGKSDYQRVLAEARPYKHFLEIRDFVADGMAELLMAADIVVSRASATALQELAALAKPVIAVPAQQLGDQAKNAAFYQQIGAAIVLTDHDLEAHKLRDQLEWLIDHSTERAKLAANIHQLAIADAASRVARLILTTRKATD